MSSGVFGGVVRVWSIYLVDLGWGRVGRGRRGGRG